MCFRRISFSWRECAKYPVEVENPVEKKTAKKLLQTVESVGADFTSVASRGDLSADLSRLQTEAEVDYYGPSGSSVPGGGQPVESATLTANAERLSRKQGDATPPPDGELLNKLIAEKSEEFFRAKFGNQASSSSAPPERKTFVEVSQEEKRADKE